MISDTCYLDANASYGLLAGLEDRLAQNLDLGNASSLHQKGQKARALIEDAREQVASLAQARQYRLVFCSGATEANNSCLAQALASCTSTEIPDVLCSALEHPSVLECLRAYDQQGKLRLHLVSAGTSAEATLQNYLSALTPATRLVSLMAANNETGDIFPVAELTRAIKERRKDILVHCDAVQALGKFEFSADDWGCDLYSLSAHKIGGLIGSGAMLIHEDMESRFRPLLYGGAQELRFRAGTENVLGIHSFGLAAHIWKEQGGQFRSNMQELKNIFWDTLQSAIPFAQQNKIYHSHYPSQQSCLPNTLSIFLPDILGDDLVVAADLQGLRISAGSACASGKPLPSPTLLALGRSEKEAKEAIRVSFRHDFPKERAAEVAKILASCILRMARR